MTAATELRLLKDIDEPGLDTIEVYERRGGYSALRTALTELDPDEVLEQIQAGDVRGRGGAGFAMGKKASFIPKGDMDKYLVCNADESEPGAFKDRVLMQKNPHLLIEGCIIAARAIEANHGFIYIRGEYELQADVVERAVRAAYERGYLGADILDSGFDFELVVHRGAGAYICGEEMALLDSLDGKRGNPRLKPPFPANAGLYQGPTLLNNVETLCNVPIIIELGPEEYVKVGSEQSKGTKVVSVSGNVQRPGNYEVPLGVTCREIIYGLAGGPPEGREVKCFFPGGSSAPVLTGDEGLDLTYDFETMAQAGSMLGSGSVIVVDDSQPLVPLALRLADFYRHESCGKCVPCREGTNWTVKMLERVESGEATPMDFELLAQVQSNILGNCLCVLGDSMAMPIGSMLEKFRAEFEQHAEEARARNEAAVVEQAAPELAAAPLTGPA
ncbi:MAG TPA: NADH-quinone oxidoreductase subunit NuoF [Thermoleophilaceae bacterium]|nr:NADH-quinone oxidoreductase subunit NuoF [Thermoleophilaceae bacterium]